MIPPKVERCEVEVLDDDDAATLLATAARTRLHVPIFLALATGLRRGELLALRWRDVDLEGRELIVLRAIEQTKAGLRFKPPKTKRGRRKVALSSSTVDLLRAHKVKQATELLAVGAGRSELVFTRCDGERVNPRVFSQEFARIVKRAGIRTGPT